MSVDALDRIMDSMDLEQGLSALSEVLKERLSLLDDEARIAFLVDLFETSYPDKLGSMVNR